MSTWRLGFLTAGAVFASVMATRAGFGFGSAATWHALRAAGFVTYGLLWLSCLAGMAVSLRSSLPALRPTHLFELHRITGVLGGAFLIGHLAGVLIDPWIAFHPVDILVGVTASYRPFALLLGAAALWCLVAVLTSTAFAGRLSYRTWLQLHRLAFPGYGFAFLHLLFAGTDRGSPLVLAMAGITAGSVAGLGVLRLAGRPEPAQASPGAIPGR